MTRRDEVHAPVERLPADHPKCGHTQDGRTIRRTRTVRVGQLDVAGAGAPVWFVVGPVDGDAGSRAGEVLDRMAALGPRFRVGLQPSPDTRRWNFTDKPSLNAEPTFDISGCATAQEILDRVVGRPPAAPISVGQAGEHLCICFDHGIGDANLMMETVAALSHKQAPNGFVDPLPAPTIANPVRSATIHCLKSAPRQVIRHAVSLANTARSSASVRARSAARGDEPIAESGKEVKDYCAVFVKSEPHFADELRIWRDATRTRASVTGLVIWSIYRALREAGIALADDCEVVVDLRRFLPDAAQTLSNFIAVARVRAGAGISHQKFCDELRATAKSIGTLVKVVAYVASVRALAAVRSHRSKPPRLVVGPMQHASVRLTISDFSKAPSNAKLLWTRPVDAELAVALPPGSASHLSIAVWVAGNGSIQATATFPASLVDTETVRNALQMALISENLCMQPVSARTDGGNGAA
jgi:hypothetical protein